MNQAIMASRDRGVLMDRPNMTIGSFDRSVLCGFDAYKQKLLKMPDHVQSKELDSFFIDLIDNYHAMFESEYEFEMASMGLSVTVERLAIVLHIDGFSKKHFTDSSSATAKEEVIELWKKRICNTINGFFSSNSDTICVYLQNDKFLILKAVYRNEEAQNIKKYLKLSFKSIFAPLGGSDAKNLFVVGFGNTASGASGLYHSIKEASLALTMGIKVGGSNKAYHLDDFGILSALAEGDIERKSILAEKTLQPLEKEGLFQTLTIYFKNNLNIKFTARDLGIHRNTVNYRLNLIKSKTGLDPKNFESAVIIKLSLFMRKFA